MKDKVFLDTNILIYLYSTDEPQKRALANTAIQKLDCMTCFQALNELCNVFVRKWRLTASDISKAIREIYCTCTVVSIDMGTIEKALSIQESYNYSYYDSLMLASALLNNCSIILTEDMQDGQRLENALTIVNIFHHPEIVA